MGGRGPVETLRRWAREAKIEVSALLLAYGDRRTPWYAKVVVVLVVAYALSPIDLIPDFIPILGQLDDLILVPLGIALAVRLVPAEVLDECRARARAEEGAAPAARFAAAAVIVLLWLAIAGR